MPAVRQTANLHIKRTTFFQITLVSTRRLPFLNSSPAPLASLVSILRKSFLSCFHEYSRGGSDSIVEQLDHKQVCARVSLDCAISHQHATSRQLAWHRLALHTGMALSERAPSPHSTSERQPARAACCCSF